MADNNNTPDRLYLTPHEASLILLLPIWTLARYRTEGIGPNYLKLGTDGRQRTPVRYYLPELEGWLRRCPPTPCCLLESGPHPAPLRMIPEPHLARILAVCPQTIAGWRARGMMPASSQSRSNAPHQYWSGDLVRLLLQYERSPARRWAGPSPSPSHIPHQRERNYL